MQRPFRIRAIVTAAVAGMSIKKLGRRDMLVPGKDHEMGVRKQVVVAVAVCVLCGSGVAQSPHPGSSPSFHLQEATIDGIHVALKSRAITCRGLVQMYLNRIAAYDQSGSKLNAIQAINARALEEADRLDAALLLQPGSTRPLHCIPVLVKDQVETSDMPTTYGSAAFKHFVPLRDATVVARLKSAGAIILAKTTMGEFASSYYGSGSGVVRNAYDPQRNPSGSSAGTGSGVAANFAAVGIGEDTGGSIRGPAAVNNLVGLRPTTQLVSRYGMMPATPSVDTLGPIARTVKDAAIVLDAIAGYDPNDPVTAYAVGEVPASYTAFLLNDGLKGARIGVIRQPMDANTDVTSDDYKKVKSVMDRAIADLQMFGATIVDPVAIPELKEPLRGNPFEAEQAINQYLAQHPNAPVKNLREILLSGKVLPRRANGLMNNVGKSTSDAGYLQVVLGREGLRRAVLKYMADDRVDALVYATYDHQPTVIPADILINPEAKDTHGLGSNRSLSPAIGFPAMTVPAGFTVDGLPVGIEFMARPFAEGTVLKFGYAYEQATRHRKSPPSMPPVRGEP